MELSRSLLKEFASIANASSEETKISNQVRGTIKSVGDTKYVQLDGSQSLTPVSEVVDAQDGDRVLVTIENHTATILGNFTFAPSARKEQDAIDKAENAQDTADDANNTSNLASQKAQEASTKADQAISVAGTVETVANEAKENAQTAITKAESASQNATEAKESAASAATSATTAREEAAAAQAAVANAQGEINKINGEITTVKGDIDTALEDIADQAAETQAIKETLEVNYAKKTEVSEVEASLTTEISKKVGELQTTVEQNYAAKTEIVNLEGRLQSQITQNAEGLTSTSQKVEKLESDTAEAQKQVDTALEKANAAQTAASNAQTAADAAKTAADAAQADATSAQTAAATAQQKADQAQALADTADKAVQAAQSDLNEAKQNLTNVTNRVGATEAEIAEAQAKVDQAQEAVNGALADAAEANLAATNAQKAADQAKLDAQEAQTAADNAQLKADNAQAVADKAQEDALKAQEDVAALTKRVTTAETNISQNAEQIALAATKVEEVGDLLKNGYYNKTETESLIQVEAGKITSSVKDTVTTEVGKIKIGGTNLLPRSTETVGSTISSDGSITDASGYSVSDYIEVTPSTDYVFTKTDSPTANPDSISYSWYDTDKTRLTTTTDSLNEINLMSPSSAYFIRFAYPTDCKVKFEKGNKATDWSPAPEDVQEDIDNAQNSADEANAQADATESRVTVAESTIEQLSDAISTLVVDENGESMMTQTSDGWRFDMSSINTQLNDAKDQLNNLSGDMGQIDQTINNLNDLANDLVNKTAYIVMTTDSTGDPCIELGKSDNQFKLRITNTSIDFMEGSSRIAYIDNQTLYIERAVIKNELQIGEGTGFIWKKRSNGNMGLRWIG